MILRDSDANTAWEDQADGTLEERTYYCQNWRADVVALMTDSGELIQQVHYDPYGVPFGIAKSDIEADGDIDNADYTKWNGYYSGGTHPYADWNWDGTVNSSDITAHLNDKNADSGLGRGDLSYAYGTAGGANRKGYAGYEIDPVLTGSEGWESVYHVRHRVYTSREGEWTRRDPLGYVDGANLYSYTGSRLLSHTDPMGARREICHGGCATGPTDCAASSGSLRECLNCCRATNQGTQCQGECLDLWSPYPGPPIPPKNWGCMNVVGGCLADGMQSLLDLAIDRCSDAGIVANAACCSASSPECHNPNKCGSAGKGTLPDGRTAVQLCICQDSSGNIRENCRGNACEILHEELIHMWQLCGDPEFPDDDRKNRLCAEIGGKSGSGLCSGQESCCADICGNDDYLRQLGYSDEATCLVDCRAIFNQCSNWAPVQ